MNATIVENNSAGLIVIVLSAVKTLIGVKYISKFLHLLDDTDSVIKVLKDELTDEELLKLKNSIERLNAKLKDDK